MNWLERVCNERKSRKRDEHGASFHSSPKINRMLSTRFICIQWNLTTPYQLAWLSKFCSLRGFSDHWSNHLFQSNQRFQAIELIEFVDRPILSWFGTKNALYYCAQSANSFSWVLFVSSYTTAIVSPHLPGSFTKRMHARETFIFYFLNQKQRNYRWVEKRLGCYSQEQLNLPREYSVSDGPQCIVNHSTKRQI